jgi:thiol-disulfide isomerase/thioredoxin
MATVSAKADTKDPLTAIVKLSSVLSLVPDKKELNSRAAALRGMLSDDQNKALAAYQDGLNLMALKDYPGAAKSFATAHTFDRGSACIDNALKQIDEMKRTHPDLFPQTAANGARLPQMVYVYATWCHWCTKQQPIIDEVRSQYQGKLAVYYIDEEKDKAAARRYDVNCYPTIIFIDSKGTEVERSEGYDTKDEIVQSIAKLGIQ